jgi:polar amino acid transport system substrate-binding protein
MSNRRHFSLALGSLPLSALAAPADTPATRRLVLVGDLNPPYRLGVGHPMGEGIDVDIAREALRLGGNYSLEVQQVPWRRALSMLEAGQADFSTGTRNTPERRQFAAFSGPYGRNVHHVCVTRIGWSDKPVRSLADMAGLTVGLVAGYAYPTALRAALTGRIEMALNMPTLLRMLAAQRIDLAVLSELPAQWLVQELKLSDQLLQQPYLHDSGAPTQMAFSLRRQGHAEALAAMNRGLAQLGKAGSWNRFETRYLQPIQKAVFG